VSRRDWNVLILGLLGIVLLVIGYYFLLLRPLLNELDQRVQERSEKQAQLSNLQQQVAQLEAVKRESPNIQRQLLELSKRVPPQPEIPTFVVQMEQIADASRVTQLRIEPGTPGQPPGGGDFSVVPITMTFNGTYLEMQDFLLRTRNLVRLVTVKNVTFCRFPDKRLAEKVVQSNVTCPDDAAQGATAMEGNEEVLEVEIQAEVYFQPSGGPAGAAPAAGASTPPETTTETTTPTSPQETTGGP
jgi:type IV pilus assembly protein PilO